MRRSPTRGRQRGQAMTEFVVGGVLFLLPLFLIVPLLGKYADVKSASAQTARYVAWERTVWYGGASSTDSVWPGNSKTDAAIQAEAIQRVVSYKRGIANDDSGKDTFQSGGARALWHNRNSSDMLQSYSDVATGAVANNQAPGLLAEIASDIIETTNDISLFKLEPNGFYVGQSAISIKTLPVGSALSSGGTNGVFDPGQFISGGKLVFRDRNVLLANGWSARGSPHVYDQVRGLTPLGVLADPDLKDVIEKVGCIALGAFVPEICGLEISKIAPDVVPPDRLTGGN